mmetsp:Transcript_25266/g.71252  ORF Transcript_25266/g.71252 Transcript_25266/m.71252 type:complete len:80 (+) Transcript_25266:140-379(+)
MRAYSSKLRWLPALEQLDTEPKLSALVEATDAFDGKAVGAFALTSVTSLRASAMFVKQASQTLDFFEEQSSALIHVYGE